MRVRRFFLKRSQSNDFVVTYLCSYRYAKANVILDDLVKPDGAPRALIDPVDPRRDALMMALDDINARFGRGSLFPGSTGVRRAWTLKADMRSPAYTSRLAEMPVVRAD